MSILIGKLEFEGPFTGASEIRPESGIFGILCQVADEYELIDLNETHCLRDCLESEEHTNNLLFYSEACSGKLSAIVMYTPELTNAERIALKNDILAEFDNETAETQEPAPQSQLESAATQFSPTTSNAQERQEQVECVF